MQRCHGLSGEPTRRVGRRRVEHASGLRISVINRNLVRLSRINDGTHRHRRVTRAPGCRLRRTMSVPASIDRESRLAAFGVASRVHRRAAPTDRVRSRQRCGSHRLWPTRSVHPDRCAPRNRSQSPNRRPAAADLVERGIAEERGAAIEPKAVLGRSKPLRPADTVTGPRQIVTRGIARGEQGWPATGTEVRRCDDGQWKSGHRDGYRVQGARLPRSTRRSR